MIMRSYHHTPLRSEVSHIALRVNVIVAPVGNGVQAIAILNTSAPLVMAKEDM